MIPNLFNKLSNRPMDGACVGNNLISIYYFYVFDDIYCNNSMDHQTLVQTIIKSMRF